MTAVSMRVHSRPGRTFNYDLESLRKRKDIGRGDSYWRIDFPIGNEVMRHVLSQAGRSTPGSDDRDDHLRALTHAIKNFPDYSALPVSTLDKFAADRKLIHATEKKLRGRKPHLVRRLINADDNPTFEFLLNLPAELRLRIYSFYLASFALVLKNPAQPPLSKVNRLIRNEIIPPFYEEFTFKFSLVSDWDDRLERSSNHLRLPPRSWMFLQSLTADNLASIKKWVIDVRIDNARINGDYYIEVHIDLHSPAHVEFKRKRNLDGRHGFRALSQKQTADLAAAILKAYQEPQDEKRKMKLTLGDIFDIRRNIEEAVLQREP